jgi:hypothetical protein
LTTFAVADIVIVTGSGPHENVMTPPAATAATTAADVQLAAVPSPTTRSGREVSTASGREAPTGTGARPAADVAGAGAVDVAVVATGADADEVAAEVGASLGAGVAAVAVPLSLAGPADAASHPLCTSPGATVGRASVGAPQAAIDKQTVEAAATRANRAVARGLQAAIER